MKAFINGMEVPFKDLGEPQVTFEGDTYEVVEDQDGEPYFMYNGAAIYIEMRDDEGNVIAPEADDEDEPEAEAEPAPASDDKLKEGATHAESTAHGLNKSQGPIAKQPAVKPAPAKPAVKDPFMQSIESYLQRRGAEDELFAVTLKKPAKNIKDCVNYIYSEVKKTGRQGFTVDEVFGMAVHYYDEDDLKAPANVTKPTTVINTSMGAPAPVELTAEEKEKARKLAVDRAIAKDVERLLAKKKAVAKAPVNPNDQPTLF